MTEFFIPTQGRDRDPDPFDNWEQNAITVEVEVTDKIRIHQVRVGCAWCGYHWMVVLDKACSRATGHMLCSHCGKFFKWETKDSESRTLRSLAKPKPRKAEERLAWRGTLAH